MEGLPVKIKEATTWCAAGAKWHHPWTIGLTVSSCSCCLRPPFLFPLCTTNSLSFSINACQVVMATIFLKKEMTQKKGMTTIRLQELEDIPS